MKHKPMQKYIPSRFNVIVKNGSSLILYNSLTGAVGKVLPENRNLVEHAFREGIIEEPQGVLKDLCERGFFVPSDDNELQRAQDFYLADRYDKDTLHLIILPTEDCNFRCVYCYELFKHKVMPPAIRKGIKLFVRGKALEVKSMHISWFGGEPLEAVDVIEELLCSCIEICREYHVDFSSSMTTNGYHLTSNVARLLLDLQVNHFQITLDGPPQEHNRRRKHISGKGTFETILKNLHDLKALPDQYMVLLRVNVDRENLPTMPEFIDFLAKNFAGDRRFSVAFRPISRWGGPDDETLPICEETRDLLSLWKTASNKGLGMNLLYNLLQPGGYVCYAAWPYSFVIRADGRINKCTVALEDELNQIGRILPSGEVVLDYDKLSLWVTADESRDTVCQRCLLRPICQGASCPLKRIKTGQRPCPPEKPHIKSVLTILANAADQAKLVTSSVGEKQLSLMSRVKEKEDAKGDRA